MPFCLTNLTMSHPIDYTVRQNVALITIDNPPVNAIGAGRTAGHHGRDRSSPRRILR